MIRSFSHANVHPASLSRSRSRRLSLDSSDTGAEPSARCKCSTDRRPSGVDSGVMAAAYATALPMERQFENNAATSVEGKNYEGIPHS